MSKHALSSSRLAMHVALAALAAGIPSLSPSGSAAAEPAVIALTKAMIETNTHPRFTLLVESQSEGVLHFTVIFPRRDKDHLADASMRVVQDGKEAVTLAIPIAVDNNNDDRAVFSASTETTRLCVLVLETGPRRPRIDEPAVTTIYRVDLSTFIPPKPEPAGEAGTDQSGAAP